MKTRAAVLRATGTARLPLVGGHEGAGVIEKTGPGVTRVKQGTGPSASTTARRT